MRTGPIFGGMAKDKDSGYRDKLGPIPAEHFDNDPAPPENIDKSEGSLYDRLNKKIETDKKKSG
jgi:hypothetical protein